MRHAIVVVGSLLSVAVGVLQGAGGGQDQAPGRRDVVVSAANHRFNPARIEVARDDLVRVTLTSTDRVYSFAIDAYRIVKRVGAGRTIVFEFRANQPGSFPFYCNLTSDPGCRDMRGTLVVRP